MPSTSPTLQNEVTFIDGITPAGTVATPSFATWAGDVPGQKDSTGATTTTTYSTTQSLAFKWGPSQTAGTTGGTIFYAFDPASNWTATEIGVFQSSMALWSALANVTFTQTATESQVNLGYFRSTDKGASENDNGVKVAVGGSALSPVTAGTISIDTTVPGFGPIVSVTAGNGYPAATIVHEVGHLLGLGHGGPYNGKVNSATQQYSAYDTRLWSTMSYISPSDTMAAYYGNYTVVGTDWGSIQAPQTPMMLDIAAIQALYGAPVTTPLSGGQVFGFRTNITGALANYFDFTKNTTPVLTLWDAGTRNTLDLSGFASDSTVNLNPGTFSSADGLVNNIAIAFGTAIDSAIGGMGDDTFTLNANSDTIDGGGGTNTVIMGGARSSFALSRAGSVITARNTGTGATSTLTNIATLTFTDATVAADSIACYVTGTLIETAAGEMPVETLAIGGLVRTGSGALRPIRWIGRRSYAGRFMAGNRRVLPVRIAAGALGAGLPRRDLLVSPEHAMFIDGLLIPAIALVNDATIIQVRGMDRVDYVHIELETHDVILAEGAPSETFVDDRSRMMFHNAADYAARYPGAANRPACFCAPRIEDGSLLEAVRRRLAAQARRMEAA